MPVFAFTNAYVTVNSVNLSSYVRSVTLSYEADELETTAMSSTAARTRIAGLISWQVELELNQDFAAGAVDATLFPLIGAAPFGVGVRPVNAARSATNPEYSGNAILTSYSPTSGSVGDLATTSATFMGTGALSRLTS